MESDLQQLRIVRRPEVLHLTGLSRATLYRLISEGAFPGPVRISHNAVGWREQELCVWLESRELVGQAEATESDPPAHTAPAGGTRSRRSAP